ncbi:MAG: hypothetical protein ACR2PS_18880 [Pseudomonadales bacterium]
MEAFTFILVLAIVDIVDTVGIAVIIVCGDIIHGLITLAIDIIAEKGFVVTDIVVTDIDAGRIVEWMTGTPLPWGAK